MDTNTIKVRVDGGFLYATAIDYENTPEIVVTFVSDNDTEETTRPTVIFKKPKSEPLRAIVTGKDAEDGEITTEIIFD